MKADLLERWRVLWQRLGLAGDARAMGERILAGYSEPSRAYHNQQHLADCLGELDTIRHLLEAPDCAELALWFHDLIYDARRHDNEERSAETATRWLRDAGVEPTVIERVASLILATKHNTPPTEPDAQFVVDIDLSVLSQPPASYALYAERIRTEYSWVPGPDYVKGRGTVLKTFLGRPAIYHTTHFRAKCEAQARANLGHELAQLTAPGLP